MELLSFLSLVSESKVSSVFPIPLFDDWLSLGVKLVLCFFRILYFELVLVSPFVSIDSLL